MATGRQSVGPLRPGDPRARSAFHQGGYDEAIRWWQQIPPEQRSAWHFNEVLSATVFLAAVVAFQEGRYQQAADRLREAGKLGLRDRRLGSLLSLSLFKAGQQLLYKTCSRFAGGGDSTACYRRRRRASGGEP